MTLRPLPTAVLLACACALLTACSSKADRIEAGLRKGSAFAAQADWDKAGVEIRNVLQIDPKNARAYFIAGQIDDGKGAIRNAFLDYSKAIELKPDFLDAKVALARVYLLGGEVDAAARLISESLAQNPANLRARSLSLALLARRGNAGEALEQARRLVAAEPGLPADSILVLAGLFVNAADAEQALKLLDRSIASDPANHSLLEMAAEVAATLAVDTASATKADTYFKAATQAMPANVGLWRSWAAMHARRGDTDQAEAVLRDAVRARPDDTPRQLALLQFLAAYRGPELAEKGYQAAIAQRPAETALRFALVDFYASRKRPEDARRTLLDIVSLGKDAPAGLTARGQLAALSLAAGDPGQARATLADVLKVNPRDRAALVLRGRIRLADGDAAGAIIDLRAAAKDQPGSAEIAALLAQAHRACGQPQLAREVLADAARFKPEDPALHLLLAQDSMLTKDSAAALLEIDQAARLAPKDARPAAMRIDLARALGDSAAVEKAMLAFETQFPNNAAGFLELGRLYESQRRFDAARAQFDIAARLAPNSAETAAAVVGLLVGQRRYADAEARAKAIIAAQPKSAFGHELWAEVALAKGDLDGAEHAFRDVIALVPKAPGAYRNLAQLKLRRHDLAGALAVLDAGKQANPDDLSLDLARAQALAGAGQVDDGIAVYEALLKRAPNNDLAANNLADLLAQAKRDPASLNRALEVARHFEASPVPVYVDTLGMVHYRLGQFDQAARLFAHAVALAPNEPALQLHYGMALYKTGAQQRGRDLLRKAIDSRRPLPDLTEAKALVAQS